MEEILISNSSGGQILTKLLLHKTSRKEDGSDVKKTISGIFSGHYLGLSRIFLIPIRATGWGKCSKFTYIYLVVNL
jgi:hypothetical protein